MTRLEAVGLVVGFVCLVVAVAAVDWRLGLALAGCGLISASVDLPRVSR